MAALSDAQIIATVADALPVGVWIARAPGGEFVYANENFQRIMGMEGRDDVAVGEYAAPYSIHGRDGAPYPEERMPFVRALVERTTVMADDIVIHRADGGRVFVRAYARPHLDEGEITHVVIAFFDITREVEAEAASSRAEALMRRAQRMESIGNLAGGIAHDFNNLLGVIRTIASILHLKVPEEETRRDLEAIDAATGSAAKLTRALLGFAGHGKNRSEPLSLGEVVESVCRLFGRTLDGRMQLVTDLQAQHRVLGDGSQLEQVVMNLLINASDAMEGKGRITVRTYDEGSDLVLEVEDQGPGVPLELRERVFEPYLTTKTRGGQRSTGLGLATVYGILQSHGATVEVDDAVDGGALFRMTFPASDRVATPATPLLRPARAPGPRGLVLVVDDEPALRRAAQRALEAAGFTVVTAKDGRDAVETYRARGGEIAAVVLDMCMPVLDGRSTFLELQAIDPGVRVLLTTGYALNEEAQEILDLGAVGFLAKPFGLFELSEAVAEVLG